MKRYITLLAALGLVSVSATAQAQQPLNVEGLLNDTAGALGQGDLIGVVDTVLVNTTGGTLPGSPAQLGGDLNNLENFLGDVQGELTGGDVPGLLNTVLANTTSGQLPGDPGDIGGDLENLGNLVGAVTGQLGLNGTGGGSPELGQGQLLGIVQVLLANTTGGGLPGQPGQIGGDIENVGAFANQLTGELTAADINGALTVLIANTTSGQPPGDPSQLPGDLENLANFLNALGSQATLPGL